MIKVMTRAHGIGVIVIFLGIVLIFSDCLKLFEIGLVILELSYFSKRNCFGYFGKGYFAAVLFSELYKMGSSLSTRNRI